MIVKPFPDVIQLENEEFNKARIKSFRRTRFSHYTDDDVLKIIIRDKTFKLNRIDKVNDMREKSYLGEAETYCRLFIGCFSYRYTESVPMWNMYTHKNRGVRISYILNEVPNNNVCFGLLDKERAILVIDSNSVKEYYLWGNKCNSKDSKWAIELSTSDIIYSDDLMRKNDVLRYFDGKPMVDIIPMAKIKNTPWDFEQETRIIGNFRTVYEGINFEVPEKILLPLNFNNINIEITLNPWRSDEFKSQIENMCKEYLNQYKYNIKESSLLGTIIRK